MEEEKLTKKKAQQFLDIRQKIVRMPSTSFGIMEIKTAQWSINLEIKTQHPSIT